MKENFNKIIFGLSSKKLEEREIEFFEKSRPLGFILFSRNIGSAEQLQDLTSSLKALLPGVLIFVDQEGGRVARLKPPIAQKEYPTAGHFGKLYKRDPEQAKEEVYKNYKELMLELRSFGIDSPCAPVCDILYEGANLVIGDRSFGDNAEQVIDLSRSAIKAINDKNSIAIIKHMPGHGRAAVDSHHALPVVDADLETLEGTDFKVFKELAKEFVDEKNVWAMTAHIVYEALDKEKPATLSNTVINYIRNNIGFKGIIVTDDICMKALHSDDGVSPESLAKVAKESLAAGCDIVLHCSGKLDEMEAVYAACSGAEIEEKNLEL